MENASKALIMAAAILIAIVLISLGVYVLGIGQESINNADMSEQEITTFNAKFESYDGDNVMGSKVNALLNTIATNNRSEGTDGRQVELDQSGTIKSTDEKAKTGKAYDVELNEDPTTGLITSITIKEKTANP